MSAQPWAPEELLILSLAAGATAAHKALLAAGFRRTMASVKGAYRKFGKKP